MHKAGKAIWAGRRVVSLELLRMIEVNDPSGTIAVQVSRECFDGDRGHVRIGSLQIFELGGLVPFHRGHRRFLPFESMGSSFAPIDALLESAAELQECCVL